MVPCFDVVVASPTKNQEVKGFGNGTVRRFFFFNQKVPRIPTCILQNRGGPKKKKIDVPTFTFLRSVKTTFEFLEVQVDKNLAVGEKIWQIGG